MVDIVGRWIGYTRMWFSREEAGSELPMTMGSVGTRLKLSVPVDSTSIRYSRRNYSEGVSGSSCLAVTRRSALVNRPIGSSSRTSHFSPSLAMIVTGCP